MFYSKSWYYSTICFSFRSFIIIECKHDIARLNLALKTFLQMEISLHSELVTNSAVIIAATCFDYEITPKVIKMPTDQNR